MLRIHMLSNQIESNMSGDPAGSWDLVLDMKHAALGFIPIYDAFPPNTVQQHNEHK